VPRVSAAVISVEFDTPDRTISGYQASSLFVKVDEVVLKVVARVTEGDYFYEAWAKDLNAAY
jgi:hypothetical protein